MDLYKGMDAAKLEAEYNLGERRGVDDFAAVVERWLQRSAAHRETVGAQVDIAYGEGEREKLDYFYSGNPNGPMLLYIHGGYWQRGDKSMYSFISEAFIKHDSYCRRKLFDLGLHYFQVLLLFNLIHDHIRSD